MTQRKQALDIFNAALQAADPAQAVLRHVKVRGGALIAGNRRYPLAKFRRIHVVGAGKAGATMAGAVEKLLGARISGGLINVKHGHTAPLKHVQLNECGHPVPDLNGVAGAEAMAIIAAQAGASDLILCLISGGASALLPLPAEPVTLAEKQETTRLLLACGANIHEMNAVRKHISGIKGGQLAALAYPATVVALVLSDVIGDDLDVIGSGPTAPDASTFGSAAAILRKYDIWDRVPLAVRRRIEDGLRGDIEETPKKLLRVQNLIVGSNRLAVDAAAARARALGLRPMILSTRIEGETGDVARMHAAIARECLETGNPVKPPACLISGGETTVALGEASGMGGRNQEFALAAAIDLAGVSKVAVFSAGTDGTDGPTDAAGAFADGGSVGRAEKLGLRAKDFLARHDSYHFFETIGGLIKTGPTGTNVMDIRVLLVG